jgi:nicotinate phosphoribosyltransferase
MFDAAGFPHTAIVLSNDLDELIIWQILTQITAEAGRYGVEPDAVINRLVYGVGTRLITSHGAPALGGVYKLVAVQTAGAWVPILKLSESPEKTPAPGHKAIWRIYDARGQATADLLSLGDEDPRQLTPLLLHHPTDYTQQRLLSQASITAIEPLQAEILRAGQRVSETQTIEAIRAQRQADLERLDPGVRRLLNPHIYHVSLTERLWELKQRLITSARDQSR